MTSPTVPSADRAQAALQLWRTRLLDLTKRNRALNYKPSRVATVTVVDEEPVEVFRHLWLDRKPMRFRPTLPSTGRDRDAADASGVADDPAFAVDAPDPAAGGALAEREFAPYDPDALAARHRDDLLQSLATPEALDVALRRLDEQARAGRDEQGVNTLFLALGMLHYTEGPDGRDVFRAPLVLLPVQLARRSARAGYVVEATDEEPLVNPALAEHLKRTFGLTLPELPSDDDATPAALQRFYGDVAELATERARAGLRGWAVKTELAVLGIVESVGKGARARYFLSCALYAAVGQSGVYTRKRGLDHETHKALLPKHLRDSPEGSPLPVLEQVIPQLGRRTIQALLKELRAEGWARVVGSRRWARWYAAQNTMPAFGLELDSL